MLLFEIGLGLALSYVGTLFFASLREDPNSVLTGTWLMAAVIIIAGAGVTLFVAYGIMSLWSIVLIALWITALFAGYRRGIAP